MEISLDEILSNLDLSQSGKYALLDWVLHELVIEAEEMGISTKALRREDVLEIVNFDLDKWL